MNLFEPLQPPTSPSTNGGMALAPGTMLEDFEIVQVLAQTRHSVIYLAHHALEGTTFAIKEFLPAASVPMARVADGTLQLTDAAQEPLFRRGIESFVAEALALSQFDHPRLLHVSRVWEGNGTAYRSMPYLPGASLLTDRANSGVPADQAQLRALRDGLLEALDVLNQAGLAHGHIEPSNILMTDGGQPVLMDFDAVRLAVDSDLAGMHVDAYADDTRLRQMTGTDLRAIAAVLHFTVSGIWLPSADTANRHEPLADVLLRFKDSASALGYEPDFVAAIDAALALGPAHRPYSVDAFRALFEPKPAAVAPPLIKAWRDKKRVDPTPPPEYPLNSTESVLNLLAKFDPRHNAADDVELFESPVVPTLTEEAEPSLPPMRTSLFDAVDAGDELPHDGVAYKPIDPRMMENYRPMPRPQPSLWQRLLPAFMLGALVVACIGALGWLLVA